MKTSDFYLLCLFLIIMPSSFGQTTKKAGEYLNANSKITAIAEAEKFFWIGTDRGVRKIRKADEKSIHSTAAASKLPSDYVTSICARKNGNIRIGTWFGGLVKVNGEKYTVYYDANSQLRSDHIRSLSIDTNGNVMVCLFEKDPVLLSELLSKK